MESKHYLEHLPAQPTALIGRESELATLRRVLVDSDASLVTVTGPGGMGKTRLALEVAAGLGGRFEDGVALVSLASVSDPQWVAASIADVMGTAPTDPRTQLAALKAQLQDRCLLLLLDNFEHLVLAAPVVAELLASCPKLKVLVTSRVRLQLTGEHELVLGGLALPNDASTPESVASAAAVNLFVRRAQAVQPGFRLTAENQSAIVSICARLDAWPLALELAAARLKLMPPELLLDRLSQRLPLLTGGAVDRPERQRTLRSTLDWSHGLLDERGRKLFAQLSVFSGGASWTAIEAVCTDSPHSLFDDVGALVDQSLVVRNGSRIGMLETVREYALERLAELEHAERVRQRHAQWFTQLAERGEAGLHGAQQKSLLDELEAEQGNFRAALEWGLSRPDSSVAVQLSAVLGLFWGMRGHVSEGRRWLETALATCAAAAPSALRAKASGMAGDLAWKQADYAAAKTRHEDALALYESLGDKSGVAEALNDLANLALSQNDLAASQRWHQESLALMRTVGNTWGIARSLMGLGNVFFTRADLAAARSHWEQSLAIFRDLQDGRAIANLLANLGALAAHQRQPAQAHAHYEEGLAMARSLGLRQLCASTAYNIGELALDRHDLVHASSSFKNGLTTAFELGERVVVSFCFDGLARVGLRSGQLEVAASLFAAAQALRDARGNTLSAENHAARERDLRALQAQLDPQAFELHSIHGRAMTLERAVAFASSFVVPAAPRATDTWAALAGLTPREVDVLRRVAQGSSDREVAAQLKISPATVSKHVANLLGKTALKNRLELTLWGMQHGLVAPAQDAPKR